MVVIGVTAFRSVKGWKKSGSRHLLQSLSQQIEDLKRRSSVAQINNWSPIKNESTGGKVPTVYDDDDDDDITDGLYENESTGGKVPIVYDNDDDVTDGLYENGLQEVRMYIRMYVGCVHIGMCVCLYVLYYCTVCTYTSVQWSPHTYTSQTCLTQSGTPTYICMYTYTNMCTVCAKHI